MLYVLIGVSALVLALLFIITEKTAPYLLSGYNLLSKTEQQKIDIKAYLLVFRKFHWGLGSSMLVIGLLLYFTNRTWSTMFLGIFPIAAYIFFFAVTMRFFQAGLRANYWVGIIVLILALGFVGYLFADGLGENSLSIQNESIVIDGKYGEQIMASDIAAIRLVDQLPMLTTRTNGFSTGDVKKGYFKTSDGEKVKLIMHTRQTPAILIKKKTGEQLFYSLDADRNQALYQQLSSAFPAVTR